MNTKLQHEQEVVKAQQTKSGSTPVYGEEFIFTSEFQQIILNMNGFADVIAEDLDIAYEHGITTLRRFARIHGFAEADLQPALLHLKQMYQERKHSFALSGALSAMHQEDDLKHHQSEPAVELSFETPPQPPRLLEAFVSLITPREKESELLGQLAEYYADHAEKDGEKWARVLYCKEIARSLAPILKLAVRYKVLEYVGEIIHRLTGH